MAPGTALRTYIYSFIPCHNLCSRYCYYYPHFTDEETEAQTGQVACRGSTPVGGGVKRQSRQVGSRARTAHVCSLLLEPRVALCNEVRETSDLFRYVQAGHYRIFKLEATL